MILKHLWLVSIAKHSSSGGADSRHSTVCSFGWEWSYGSDDRVVIDGIKAVLEHSISAAKERGLYHPFKYMNYAALDQNPIESYGKDNIEFLKRVRAMYDPEGVFTYLLPGGHKIS